MLKLLNETLGTVDNSDAGIISHTIEKLGTDLEDSSVQKRDYKAMLMSNEFELR